MALMAAAGELGPMPDAAIFADTKAEPQSVYDWLDWLEKELPFPVIRVSNGSLTEKSLEMKTSKSGRVYTATEIPFFVKSPAGELGKIPNRSCTKDFKIIPIHRKIKELIGHKKGSRLPKEAVVTQWIGISLDEVSRMKESLTPWLKNIWPLVDLRMNRNDCKRWMKKAGYPEPPRSSCIYCPFHNHAEWRRLKQDEPEEFEKAVQFEQETQRRKSRTDRGTSIPYLHRSCIPIDQVDFSTMEDRGQLNFFENECEGMCGV